MDRQTKKREYQREWYYKNRKNNPVYTEKRRAYLKKWREKFGKSYREKTLDKRRKYDREWKRQYKLKYPDKVKEKRRERYRREKKKPERLIGTRLRIRIWGALKRRKNKAIKSGKTEELIGTTTAELKKHLEKQFEKGMAWKNYGQWHVDHRIPCASFDLTKPEEQKKAFHYTNLQPLWAKDNMRKGVKIS